MLTRALRRPSRPQNRACGAHFWNFLSPVPRGGPPPPTSSKPPKPHRHHSGGTPLTSSKCQLPHVITMGGPPLPISNDVISGTPLRLRNPYQVWGRVLQQLSFVKVRIVGIGELLDPNQSTCYKRNGFGNFLSESAWRIVTSILRSSGISTTFPVFWWFFGSIPMSKKKFLIWKSILVFSHPIQYYRNSWNGSDLHDG